MMEKKQRDMVTQITRTLGDVLADRDKEETTWQQQMQDTTQRGTLQEFIEWAQGNFDGHMFAVVTSNVHSAKWGLKKSGYGYTVYPNEILLTDRREVSTNCYLITDVDDECMRDLISGTTLAGIYFCDEPTEQAYAMGASRCSVVGAKVWIAPNK